jgi:hypothetical protein
MAAKLSAAGNVYNTSKKLFFSTIFMVVLALTNLYTYETGNVRRLTPSVMRFNIQSAAISSAE